jgi:tetratricopeptide (TPR) repeat protein
MNEKALIVLIGFLTGASIACVISTGAIARNKMGLQEQFYGKPDSAIEHYTEAIALDAGYAEAYFNRGRAYYFNGDYNRAIADYDRAIILDPQFALAYYGRGLVHADREDLDQAIADFDQAILWLAQADKGDFDRDIDGFLQAIPLDQQLALAYRNRGFTYAYRGNYDQAIADFGQAIALDPQLALAYYDRGLAYADKGDYDQAIAHYDQAIALDPQHVYAPHTRGLAYEHKGDFQQTISLDRRLAIYNRGLAYANKGDYDRATADLESALDQGLGPSAKQDAQRFLEDWRFIARAATTSPEPTAPEPSSPVPLTATAEPPQVGTLTQLRSGCTFDPADGPISAGEVGITIVEGTFDVSFFHLWRLAEDYEHGEFNAYIEEQARLANAGERALYPPSQVLDLRELNPREGSTTKVFETLQPGTYAIVCFRTFRSVGISPFALAGPFEIAE